RRPVWQAQDESRGLPAGVPVDAHLSEFSRRTSVGLDESVIEAPDAAVPRSRGYVRHRQRGVVDQALGEMQPLGMRDGKRRGAEVPGEKASQMPARDSEAVCQEFDIAFIERA